MVVIVEVCGVDDMYWIYIIVVVDVGELLDIVFNWESVELCWVVENEVVDLLLYFGFVVSW